MSIGGYGILNEYEDKIVLVTGGAGCVGSNLSRKIAELNAEKVIILDDLSSAYEWNIPQNENIEFIKGDILDDRALKRVFKEKPDHVFHLAAHFANQNSVDNPEKNIPIYNNSNYNMIIITFNHRNHIKLRSY